MQPEGCIRVFCERKGRDKRPLRLVDFAASNQQSTVGVEDAGAESWIVRCRQRHEFLLDNWKLGVSTFSQPHPEQEEGFGGNQHLRDLSA